jgi:hypothetical protein
MNTIFALVVMIVSGIAAALALTRNGRQPIRPKARLVEGRTSIYNQL